MQYHPESKLPLPTLFIAVASAVILVAVAANASTSHHTSSNRELDLISHMAQEGDAGAQLQLGLAYRDGRYGLEPDAKTERYWLAQAARLGNGYAADILANSYAQGEGSTRNSEQAAHWWEVAAQDGNADGQTHLGQYLLSHGLDRDASVWLRRAASRGDDVACAELTKLYRKALVSPVDLQCGENPVAALGERLDSTGLKTLFTVWNTVELASPDQQSASTLLQRADRGDPVAEYQLALHFRDGAWAVKRDPEQSDLWIHRAAADGNPLAINELARKSEP